jgi:hypothetical protein
MKIYWNNIYSMNENTFKYYKLNNVGDHFNPFALQEWPCDVHIGKWYTLKKESHKNVKGRTW